MTARFCCVPGCPEDAVPGDFALCDLHRGAWLYSWELAAVWGEPKPPWPPGPGLVDAALAAFCERVAVK